MKKLNRRSVGVHILVVGGSLKIQFLFLLNTLFLLGSLVVYRSSNDLFTKHVGIFYTVLFRQLYYLGILFVLAKFLLI